MSLTSARLWRWVAGAAVLAVLGGFGVLLIPHYQRNVEFERALEGIVRQGTSVAVGDEVLRARVLDRAAALGLAVQAGQVRVRRTSGGLRIEVRYAAPVELSIYTVDLHFRASAGQ